MRRQRLCSTLLLLTLLTAPLAAARAAERSTAVAEVAFTYGVRAYNHGDFAEAVRLFQEAVAADPGNREACEWLAAAQRRQSESAAVTAPGFEASCRCATSRASTCGWGPRTGTTEPRPAQRTP